MTQENKNPIMDWGIIFVAVILMYKLPHSSFSLIEHIIPPIELGNGRLMLAGLVPIALFIIGIKGIFKHKRFADKNRFLVFFLVILLVVPIMRGSLDAAKKSYYWLTDNGLQAINLKNSTVSTLTVSDEMTLKVKLDLFDYGRSRKEFKVRWYLPEDLETQLNMEYIEFEETYRISGGGPIILTLEESITPLSEYDRIAWHMSYSHVVELYNDNSSVRLYIRN